MGYLQQARLAAGNPRLQWLSERAQIPQSTLEQIVYARRRRLPGWSDQVVPLLSALRRKAQDDGRDPDAMLGNMGAWRRAHGEVEANQTPVCPLPTMEPTPGQGAPQGPGWLVAMVNPLDLEVHPAIDAGARAAGLDALPAYVRRQHDEHLDAVVNAVRTERESRIVVLVGGSSTGKTRALWEAVSGLGDPWRLWHPINPGRPEAALADLGALRPHTVVWLNEIQQYLLTAGPEGEQVAAGLRELLRSPERGPVLVVGTLWPRYAGILTAVPSPGEPDPHDQARELLKRATVRLPDTFTGDDLRTATTAAAADPRLAQALACAPSGALTQYLAGGPALIQRYEQADLAARAVLHAAIDARRLGHRLELPRRLLEDAAAAYLSDHQWDLLDDDWPEKAFSYLTDPLPCRGAYPPLIRIRPRPQEQPQHGYQIHEPRYRLADYLEDHGGRTRRWICPPAGFWDAITRHASPHDCTALAHAAEQRGRYRHAFHLWERSDARDAGALKKLVRRRERVGDQEGAERLAWAVAGIGYAATLVDLARLRAQFNDQKGAEQLYRAIANAGDRGELETEELNSGAADTGNTLQDLARRGEQVSDQGYAEQLARAAADDGDIDALVDLAEIREQAGDREGAEQVARAALEAGNTRGLRNLAEMREQAGDQEGAERLYSMAVQIRSGDILGELAEMRERVGDHKGAERFARAAVDSGNTWALRELAAMREQAGERDDAERLARVAAEAGNTWALADLAEMRERAGDQEGAERLAQVAATAGDSDVLAELAEIREQKGDREGVERLVQAGADDINSELLLERARRRQQARGQENAEGPDLVAIEAEDSHALADLVRRRQQVGDQEGAEQLAHAAAHAGNVWVLRDLALSLEQQGDRDGAKRLYHAAADAGNTGALAEVARLRQQAGDLEDAERLARMAADAGHTWALWELAELQEKLEPGGQWGILLRFGLEGDGRIADPW
ncbi:hypothetical protein [Sphaerisporangium sp. TRM90804]|uniref:tetratricopeptide repeat protein n=1 Tax=Sphaerisporangium sp. TRM90804 TaxID=3031113 RepID=UPI00244B6275|nr:hypothetical protein [Sphaerisporangium sp. TRM90804]MDH2426456.1 hypothetical protein [Sphaerisporangium sp. TRM90804]